MALNSLGQAKKSGCTQMTLKYASEKDLVEKIVIVPLLKQGIVGQGGPLLSMDYFRPHGVPPIPRAQRGPPTTEGMDLREACVCCGHSTRTDEPVSHTVETCPFRHRVSGPIVGTVGRRPDGVTIGLLLQTLHRAAR